MVWLNILYLLPLSILPFGASLIANYEAESVALRLYGFLLVAIGASRLAIWMYATRRPRLLYSAVDRQSRRAGVAIVAVPGVAYAIAILVAAAAPTASLVIYAAVPVVYFIGITIARTSGRPGSAEQDFT